MKTFFLAIPLFFLSFFVSGQKSVNKLIDNIKKHPKSITMTLPGWLISKTVDIASHSTEMEKDEQAWLDMAKSIKQIRFSVVDENSGLLDQTVLQDYIKQAKMYDGFEEYARVKNEDNHVHVLIKNKKDEIKNILLYALSEDAVVAIHLKTDISINEFKKANFSFNKNKNDL